MRVAFHTLGCKVNQYETEAMKEAFVSRGADIVSEDEAADVYIVNTCTVTNIADRKSRQYIRRMKSLNPDAFVAVTGCYAQVAADEIAEMPEVDLIVGNGSKAAICDMVYERMQEGLPCASFVMPRSALTEYEDMGLVVSSESGMTRAYIKIQEGCDRFCSYCLIPFARGTVRSRPLDEIIREAELLVSSGYKELVLTGINTALYGTEKGYEWNRFPGEEDLMPMQAVLSRLDNMEGDFRVRLSSLEPTVVDKDDVEKIIRYKRLCHHLHLSIQSGSSSVLARMNRHYTREEYLEIVKALRSYDPLYGITTDIIVGFPGETESDFEDTLDIVRRAEFGRVHGFRYSPRRGTAGETLPDAVPGNVKNERAGLLEAEAEKAAAAFMEKNKGVTHTVLTEEIKDGYVTGYTGNYIRVYIENAENIGLGEFCNVELKQKYLDGCIAVLRQDG